MSAETREAREYPKLLIKINYLYFYHTAVREAVVQSSKWTKDSLIIASRYLSLCPSQFT
jgi:hypothetical protein